MGPCHAKRGRGNHAKNKHFRKYVLATKHRARDLDQIREDLKKRGKKIGVKTTTTTIVDNTNDSEIIETINDNSAPLPTLDIAPTFDEDLPGGGLYYCIETARYFVSQDALDKHKKSKQYKQRVKELIKEANYTQEDADLAAGLKKESLPKVSKRNEMDLVV
jgi:bud site selection protein 20